MSAVSIRNIANITTLIHYQDESTKTTAKIDANVEIIILNASLVSNLAFQYANVKSYLEDYTILPSENDDKYKCKTYGNRRRIVRPQYKDSKEILESIELFCFIENLYDALSE